MRCDPCMGACSIKAAGDAAQLTQGRAVCRYIVYDIDVQLPCVSITPSVQTSFTLLAPQASAQTATCNCVWMNFYLLALCDQVESFRHPLIAADERTARWKPLCVFDAPIQHLMRLFLTSKKKKERLTRCQHTTNTTTFTTCMAGVIKSESHFYQLCMSFPKTLLPSSDWPMRRLTLIKTVLL